MLSNVVRNVRGWQVRRWLVAAGTAVLVYVVVAIPTDLIPNPWFAREIPPTWWSHSSLAASAVLTGLLMASYVASPLAHTGKTNKAGLFGSIITFFAVGCPVCNKLVLIALGSAGALNLSSPCWPSSRSDCWFGRYCDGFPKRMPAGFQLLLQHRLAGCEDLSVRGPEVQARAKMAARSESAGRLP